MNMGPQKEDFEGFSESALGRIIMRMDPAMRKLGQRLVVFGRSLPMGRFVGQAKVDV